MAYPQAPRREDFQIAIICALPLEYDAITFAFDEFWDDNRDRPGNASGDYNIYKTGRMGTHSVVLLLLPNMGKVNAASATASLRSTYTEIKLAVLTGICGGVPSPWTDNELLLGDVVISKSIVEYDLGRRYPGEFVRKDTIEGSHGRPNKEIRSLVATFETRQGRRDFQSRAGQMLTQIQQKAAEDGDQALYRRPSSTEDLLFEPGYLHRHPDRRNCGCSDSGACETARNASCETLQCDKGRIVTRKRLVAERQQDDALTAPGLQVFVGHVGSGDTVMKSGLDRDRIAAEQGLIAFEMEGAGIWDEIPCIIIKAVCDYADSHKNKQWQNYAAATAASATKALLEYRAPTDRPMVAHTWSIIPYNENPDFVGRSNILGQIRQLFGHEPGQQPAAISRPRVALYGLGGIGKTQIALAYVYWIQHACPNVSVFWVHASNAERFRQAYYSIAQECCIPGHDDPKADVLTLVKAWLERGDRGRWLMVIDNADDTQLFFPQQSKDSSADAHQVTEARNGLGQYIPECRHGSILITARNKQTGSRLVRGKPMIEVGEMSESEAQLLLHKIIDDKIPTEKATVLSAKLGHLPLALAQAAAFINENSISIKEYLQLLDESDDSLVDRLSEPFEAVGRDSKTPHAVTATWIVSFDQIQQQDALASKILSFASLLDRQAIPKRFVVHYCDENHETGLQGSTAEVTKALGTLKAFSLVSEAKNDTVDMHQLVQLVTRKWLANLGKFTEFAKQAVETVSNMYPYGQHDSREVCRDTLPHAYAVLKNNGTGSRDEGIAKASLLYCMTGYFLYMGHWKDAEKSADEGLELRRRLLGEEDPHTLNSMANLASTYRNQGRLKEAEELEVRVMETSKMVLGEEHPDTLSSMANLASTYRNQGRWKGAEELEVRVMETRKTVLGEEHPSTTLPISGLVQL